MVFGRFFGAAFSFALRFFCESLLSQLASKQSCCLGFSSQLALQQFPSFCKIPRYAFLFSLATRGESGLRKNQIAHFNPSTTSFTSHGSQPGLDTSDQNQGQRSSATALVLPPYSTHQRGSAQTPEFNSASASPHYYPFEGDQEERKPVIVGLDQQNRNIEYTGKQNYPADSSHAYAYGSTQPAGPLNHHASTSTSAFGTGTGPASQFSGALGKGSIAGTRGPVPPFTPQEHRLLFNRQRAGSTSSHNYQQALYSFAGQSGVTSYRPAMSDDMFQTNVDLDGLESYEDDDILGGLPQNSYDGGGFSVTESGSGLSKKDDKLVRRRSSKGENQ